MFQIYGTAVTFCLQLWKGFENDKKTKQFNQEEIRKQLLKSLVNSDTDEIEKFNEQARIIDKPEDAPELIKQYKEILKTKRKGIISVAYYQRKIRS